MIEEVMKFWKSMWKRPFTESEGRNKLLVVDMHRAQTTDDVKQMLENGCRTSVAPGTTSLIQPLDVAVNSDLKAVVDRLQHQHMHDNLSLYIENKLKVSERRILITKWVGQD